MRGSSTRRSACVRGNRRCAATTGDGSVIGRAEACLDELAVLERRELRRALTGEQHRTLWGRPGLGDAAAGGSSGDAIP